MCCFLITLSSFTSVISENSTELLTKKESPLFGLRIKKSISTQNKVLTTTSYIGKGKLSTIDIPINNDMASITSICEAFKKMTDEQMDEFVIYIYNIAKKKGLVGDEEFYKIKSGLYELRNSPDILKGFGSQDSLLPASGPFSIGLGWFPGCILGDILFGILLLMAEIGIILILAFFLVINLGTLLCTKYNYCNTKGGVWDCPN